MEVYLVGGAVRDELLGRKARERDWVVVGATPEEMLRQGFRQVGREFPVFLHPQTQEEHALARRERKSGTGYRGFVTDAAPTVTLEEDLGRRDLTINAMARAADGTLIDPHGGRHDLEARLLRHVSQAFVEDPVRILRVARFAARFAPLGFGVAEDTLELMRAMVRSGEVTTLVPERVWQETERALGEARPVAFFEVLRSCGALARIFPEVEALFGVPQPAEWHPEIDTGVHTFMVLDMAASLSPLTTVRFAALTHDLGKAHTPREKWPRHPGHEVASVRLVEELCARLRIPNEFRELAVLVARHHGVVHRAFELRPGTVLDLLESSDALRRPERFEAFLLACEADARGRTGLEHRAYGQAEYLRSALRTVRGCTPSAEDIATQAGVEIAARLRERRLKALSALRPPAA
ncbi:MAG TPA: multifunctional CCA addition/repair protein [Steroidobacteraceae bacterium]|nr:multifunctional CCA addition/repair protein [Steroidobacteraceae bacterium]